MLMKKCWRKRHHRPSFRNIIAELLPDLSETFAPVSYYCSVLCAAGRHLDDDVRSDEHRALSDPESDTLTDVRRGSTPSTACVREASPANEAGSTTGSKGEEDESVACIQPLTQPMATYCNGKARGNGVRPKPPRSTAQLAPDVVAA